MPKNWTMEFEFNEFGSKIYKKRPIKKVYNCRLTFLPPPPQIRYNKLRNDQNLPRFNALPFSSVHNSCRSHKTTQNIILRPSQIWERANNAHFWVVMCLPGWPERSLGRAEIERRQAISSFADRLFNSVFRIWNYTPLIILIPELNEQAARGGLLYT